MPADAGLPGPWCRPRGARAGNATATARAVAETVTDPELPMLTLADLGVLREVSEAGGTVTVSITPTYTGCPAMDAMRDDLVHALHLAGFPDVEVRTVLQPAWSTDWISAAGRRKLTAGGHRPAPRRSRAGDRADPADPRAAAGSGALPALRLRPDQAHVVFQRDRLPVAAPLRGLPGAVRARQGDLSGDDDDRAAAAGTVPHADRGRGEPAVRGRRGGDLRRPGRAGRAPTRSGPASR